MLAAVACGGMIGRAQIKLAAQTRLETTSLWELVEFVLASLVFLLVGLQLRGILDRLTDFTPGALLLLTVAISLVLIVSRFVWVFFTFYPASAVIAAVRGGSFTPPLSHPTIISWAGMRGVVSLAVALALPTNFPERDIIVFLAFCAIFTTLVIQGTTLKLLIAWFDLRDPAIAAVDPATVAAREMVAAAIAGVGTSAMPAPGPVDAFHEQRRDAQDESTPPAGPQLIQQVDARLQAIERAREELQSRRDEIDGETLQTLTQELDLEERQIRLVLDDQAAAETHRD